MANIIEMAKKELTFENVLRGAIGVPGVKINRAQFLRKELRKYCSEQVIENAIQCNPAQAGISKELINTVSKAVINYETNKVTALSVAASVPGGAAAVGAAVADITSYFVFVLRIVQELAYLYGFDQFELNENDIDAETMNQILLFIGVMFGVQGAAGALKRFADVLARNVEKKLAQKALMKVGFYRLVKRIAAVVGVQMTKQIFADYVASVIPVAGGLLSGGLTYAMFRPNCMKLRKSLMSYNLCDPNYYREPVYEEITEDIEDDDEI